MHWHVNKDSACSKDSLQFICYMAALEGGTGRVRSVAGGVSIAEVTLSEICDLESEVRRAGLTRHAFSKHTRLHSRFSQSGADVH